MGGFTGRRLLVEGRLFPSGVAALGEFAGGGGSIAGSAAAAGFDDDGALAERGVPSGTGGRRALSCWGARGTVCDRFRWVVAYVGCVVIARSWKWLTGYLPAPTTTE